MHHADRASQTARTRVITLGGGCFWCTEAVFVRVQGVHSVVAGYANGHVPNPTYAQVCEGDTGHNEVVQVTYDPAVVSLRRLLEIFMTIHDPTTLNRQGNDVGMQYRSGVYYSDEADRAVAQAALDEAQAVWGGQVVTELQPLQCFYEAEAYHQHYYDHNPQQGYCAFVIAPKVQKLLHHFADQVRHA
jgi:peptide-methionine (S)-S-oxide reductase